MKVLADPRFPNGHPYHQHRFITTDDCELHVEGEHWVANTGSVVAQMTDTDEQANLAHLFAAAPDLLRIVRALFYDVNSLNATLAACDSSYRGTPLNNKLTALMRAVSELPPALRLQMMGEEEEPTIDDSVKCCPDCETPNQFGELCARCIRDRELEGNP